MIRLKGGNGIYKTPDIICPILWSVHGYIPGEKEAVWLFTFDFSWSYCICYIWIFSSIYICQNSVNEHFRFLNFIAYKFYKMEAHIEIYHMHAKVLGRIFLMSENDFEMHQKSMG